MLCCVVLLSIDRLGKRDDESSMQQMNCDCVVVFSVTNVPTDEDLESGRRNAIRIATKRVSRCESQRATADQAFAEC